MATPIIDRDKLRAHARTLPGADLLVWLDRAIDLLPKSSLPKPIKDYARAKQFAPDEGSRPDLLETIRRFHAASLASKYYQDFAVNSHNFMETSRGTERWIAEHTRLLDGCMRAERDGKAEMARQGFDLLMDLLRAIDGWEADIIFFADEGGSWQVGVNWRDVLPAWFRCLAPATAPAEYAELVVQAIDDFADYDATPLLAAAHEVAGPEQSAALAAIESRLRQRR